MVLGSSPPAGMTLTASSGYIPVTNATLNSGVAWCAAIKDQNQYLQIDFGKKRTVSGIAVQGDPVSDNWVTKFQLMHGNNTSTAQKTLQVCIWQLSNFYRRKTKNNNISYFYE